MSDNQQQPPAPAPAIHAPNRCEECSMLRTEVMEQLYSFDHESADIRFCRKCGQIYKCRWQCDPGTGCDNIILMPGEVTRNGYHSFALEEAQEAIDRWQSKE